MRFGCYTKHTQSRPVHSMPGNSGVTAFISSDMALRVKIKRQTVFPYRFIFSPPPLPDIPPRYNVSPSWKKKKKKRKKEDRKKAYSMERDISLRENEEIIEIQVVYIIRGFVLSVRSAVHLLSVKPFFLLP